MRKLLSRTRYDGGTDHRHVVKSRVRNLASVSHELTEDGVSAEDIRRKLNGGRSALASTAGTR